MKRTPSSARRIARSVLTAVEPTYSPTRPARSTSTRCPRSSSPSERYICASSRATVVLPVPGLPRKTRCCDVATSGSSSSRRRACTSRNATSARTCCFTVSRPTSASSSAWSSASGRGGSLRASVSRTTSNASAPGPTANRSPSRRNASRGLMGRVYLGKRLDELVDRQRRQRLDPGGSAGAERHGDARDGCGIGCFHDVDEVELPEGRPLVEHLRAELLDVVVHLAQA